MYVQVSPKFFLNFFIFYKLIFTKIIFFWLNSKTSKYRRVYDFKILYFFRVNSWVSNYLPRERGHGGPSYLPTRGPGGPFKAEGNDLPWQNWVTWVYFIFARNFIFQGFFFCKVITKMLSLLSKKKIIIAKDFFLRERIIFFSTISESFWSSTVVEKNTHIRPSGFYSSQVGRLIYSQVNTWIFHLFIMGSYLSIF